MWLKTEVGTRLLWISDVGHIFWTFFADANPFKYFVRLQKHEIGSTETVGTKLCVAKTIS